MGEGGTAGARRALAERLRAARDTLASRVNDEFFSLHPDWLERYGDRGVRHGFEDACFHIDFLLGAIEVDSHAVFEDYVRWASEVLSARGIEPRYLAESLHELGNACRTALTVAEHQYVESFIRAGAAVVENPPRGADGGIIGKSGERTLVCRLFTRAILQGQRKAAAGLVMEEVEKGASLLDIYLDVLEAAQFEIGRLWETNTISVAEEHMATAITQYVIAQLYPRINRSDAIKGRIVVTGVEGEFHQIGPNIVADVLEASGWDVRFLGTNVPHRDILRAIEKHSANVVGISVMMLFNVPLLINLIESIHRAFGRENLRVVIGGGAFRSRPGIWKETGAQGFAQDAREALMVMNTLA
jgi:MerR family transcriptional regulator, light-induced transcriptional regulator